MLKITSIKEKEDENLIQGSLVIKDLVIYFALFIDVCCNGINRWEKVKKNTLLMTSQDIQ
jgi:hypothetical protein